MSNLAIVAKYKGQPDNPKYQIGERFKWKRKASYQLCVLMMSWENTEFWNVIFEGAPVSASYFKLKH